MASRSTAVAALAIRAVKARKPIATRAALILTPAAVRRIKDLLQEKPQAVSIINGYIEVYMYQIGLKVGVKQRGCNGLSYTLDYCFEKGKMDEMVHQDGVCVVIDRKAQLTLLGTEMDYMEDKLTSEFIFNNPNIKGTCGCGESFSV